MAYRLPPLPALRAFESAARLLSFKSAAEELHVTPAAISQQIKTLEDYLDVQLFRRLTRRLELTDEAEAMLPKVREAFECLAAAVESTRHPRGTLTVCAPPNFATRWLVKRLPRFTQAHPEIELHLSSGVDAIDRQRDSAATQTETIDPRKDTTRVSIRFGDGRLAGHRNDFIMAPDYTLVCSPRLLNGEPPLRTPDDLRKHTLIHDESIVDVALRPSWEEWLRIAGATNVVGAKSLHFGNTTLALEAALGGQGAVLAPRQLVTDDVAAGRLVIPFDVTISPRYFYYLAAPEAIADRPAVRAFRDWLKQESADETR